MAKFVLAFLLIIASTASAQQRKAVGAKEVTGTFRGDCYGKSCNEVRILAIGNNQLRVSFEGYYPWLNGDGVNIGFTSGVARIDADTAVFAIKEDFADEECRIVIRFRKPGEIEVEHLTPSFNCGFGNNVMVDGTYKKVSSKKPKIKAKDEE